MELGRYLCEVREGQYWRLEKLKSFDEFLARRFPESRRKADYLMSFHEYLPPHVRKELKEIGWTKGRELANLAGRDGQHFDCALWVHKAQEMSREDFRIRGTCPAAQQFSKKWFIVYFCTLDFRCVFRVDGSRVRHSDQFTSVVSIRGLQE